MFISSQDIEQKPISDVNHYCVINEQKRTANNPNQVIVNTNELLKFGENLSICS